MNALETFLQSLLAKYAPEGLTAAGLFAAITQLSNQYAQAAALVGIGAAYLASEFALKWLAAKYPASAPVLGVVSVPPTVTPKPAPAPLPVPVPPQALPPPVQPPPISR